MPKFAVVAPSHFEKEKKKESWERFRDGGYIAWGSVVCDDLTNKSMDEIKELVQLEEIKFGEKKYKQRASEYERFFSLNIGDYVAVKNTNAGLFGIGIVASDYYFKKRGHNPGSTNPDDFYCHFRKVNWINTTYMERKNIIKPGDRSWAPYGIIHIYPEVPEYIKRIISNI